MPVVALAGTCMEAGKTAAAAAIISRMRHRGLVVDAFKATGVSLRRDIMAFEDAGARNTLIFTDFGIVSTTRKVGPALTRTMLTELSEKKPDVIVFELGDGLLGTYGVDSILEQEDMRKAFTGVVLSANDPVAAYGGVDILRKQYGIEPIAVTGPSTDNDVGVSIIRDQLKVPAFNALAAGAALGDSIIESVGLTQARPARSRRERIIMANKIPAIVLGGTGYVSGELLRLIIGHPDFTLAGVMSDSSPGELAGKSFPHLAGALGNTAFKSQAEIAALIAKEPTSAVFCAAPHGAAAALIDSLLKAAEAAGTKPRFVDISADFRFATAAAYEAVYKHPHGAPHRLAQFTCAVPEHLKKVTHAARRASGLLLHGHPAGERAAAVVRHRRAHVVRQRRHRQHRLGPQARRRHASPDAPQRPLFLWRARPPPHARDHRARQGGIGRRSRIRVRAALRSVRARHPRHGAGAAQVAARCGFRRGAAARVLRGLPVRARARQRAARERHRRQQLRAPDGRGQWPHDRRDERGRQPQQGRRRRRRAMDEPPVRPARNRGAHRARQPGWT